jgi:serine/threonine protein kinase
MCRSEAWPESSTATHTRPLACHPTRSGNRGRTRSSTPIPRPGELHLRGLRRADPPPPHLRPLDRLARFEREAKLLASLNHPGIAHLYGFEDVALEGGATAHVLVMELVEGEDLAERLKRGAIPVEEALEVATGPRS